MSKLKINAMNNLENEAIELPKIKKEPPFRVPENYFGDFSARMMSRIEAEEEVVPVIPKRKIIRYLKPAIGLAAGFALVFSLAYWPMKKFTPGQSASNQATEINQNDLLMKSWVEDIDENSFYALLEEPEVSNEFTDEELINYVNTHSSDYEIYNETENDQVEQTKN